VNWNEWRRYNRRGPLSVKGGIKSRSQRGKFVENWWADRWIRALTALIDSRRLARGKRYARRGQVIEIDVEPGRVTALVQGSRFRPYQVEIELQPLNDAQWDAVFRELSRQAIFAAQLLNGEMPVDIEQVFNAVSVPLFPDSAHDLSTDCSCPDWANPCKHVAAVYYLLGERFDDDPFLLFALRGRTQEQVMAALRERRTAGGTSIAEQQADYALDSLESVKAAPLEQCVERYWSPASDRDPSWEIRPPQLELALSKRLGVPAFADPSVFPAVMESVYRAVTVRALDVAFADAPLSPLQQDEGSA